MFAQMFVLIWTFVPMFVEAPPLWLMHIGKAEVLGRIDLLEDQWDQLMVFDPAAYGLEGTIDPSIDPQQEYGIHGFLPKKPAGKLKLEQSLAADNLGFANTFEFKQTEAYLKANSEDPDNPLTMFVVSDINPDVSTHNWTLVLMVMEVVLYLIVATVDEPDDVNWTLVQFFRR